MSNVAIKAEKLGKKYLIGHNAPNNDKNATFRETISKGVKDLARKSRDMLRGDQIVQGDRVEEFWALKDISFEIKKGDKVGVIGRNGAGKSTLLKILSRISEPTKGRVSINGRVASLLEVGTGFHPELSGRENIFLNGAILGMTDSQIRRKFDEIVAFSEVERFLDTPVKRYSSGMYVRLAFSVAAHLEPDILIVDEVLAVGDVKFQEKCLGRMESGGDHGRTVIFVSHNTGSMMRLCNSGILLDAGEVSKIGTIESVIQHYTSTDGQAQLRKEWGEIESPGDDELRIRGIKVKSQNKEDANATFSDEDSIQIVLYLDVLKDLRELVISCLITDALGNVVVHTHSNLNSSVVGLEKGHRVVVMGLPKRFFLYGRYSITVAAIIPFVKFFFDLKDVVSFEVSSLDHEILRYPRGDWKTSVNPMIGSWLQLS